MQSRIAIDAAMVAMAREMSIRHLFDDSLQNRGAGVLRYVLAIGVERYLAWYDDDADEMVVSPLGLWGAENVADVLDDEVLVWFVREGEASGCTKVIRSLQLVSGTVLCCIA